jgi:geranylgeranyl pyrophosphate synthase
MSLNLLNICSNSIIEELKNMLVGQSLDLRWVHDVTAPSVEEYLQMVDGSKLQLHAHRTHAILTNAEQQKRERFSVSLPDFCLHNQGLKINL